MRAFADVQELLAAEGADLGATAWREITQEQVDSFADTTDDHQWIHVDADRAAKGPFRGPIAHGYLTLALVIPLYTSLIEVTGITMGINYGLEKVRFPSPVRVGSRIRLAVRVDEVTDVPRGVQAVMDFTVEIEGIDKPACVCRPIYRYYA